MKKLLIVESPAKAKTIGKYLGKDFIVKSSVGHIRDLPKDGDAITITEEGEGKWSFSPKYVVSKDKEKIVADLRKQAKNADEIFLASDPDREGEAIAWHLYEVLKPVAGDKPFHRVTYNEITKSAVTKAVAEPREIDMSRVDAQQARRILDRLVGYKVSPLLWKYIQCPNNRTLSAGRVQSVALRLLVERQKEIDAFVSTPYYILGVEAKKEGGTGGGFVAKLARLDGEKPDVKAKEVADNLLLDLMGANLEVDSVKAQAKLRHAYPPFTTSTMQQAASSVLSFSPGRTMKIAQSLYEAGLITYMRTDSVNVAEVAREAAKNYIISNFGDEYYPAKPNFYKSKETSQGAHEAIRPTDIAKSAADAGLSGADAKLYELIRNRFLASQMSDARTTLRTAMLSATKNGILHKYEFSASATDIDFDGFMKVMKVSKAKKKSQDDESEEDNDEIENLPELKIGEELSVVRWIADEKMTKGPTHYSEASLIKTLEENGVGRPSTYAQTIETLKVRGYAESEKRRLIPLERGTLVCDWLVKKLDSLFNVGYTAKMEAELDKVEDKGEPMNQMLSEFYCSFRKALAGCQEPAPDRSKFDFVFGLLEEVAKWTPQRVEGKRRYDDKAFVESIREQVYSSDKPPTARQLDYLIKMAVLYSSQINDVENRLKEAGLGAGASIIARKADPALVEYCFGVLDRIGGMMKNPFLKSLRDQFDRGRALSLKQFGILARSAGENSISLPDCAEIREKLKEFVPDGFAEKEEDPAIPKLLAMLDSVTEWRPSAMKGKKLYDDKGFVESLKEQFERRHTLSSRQLMALKRVAVSYKEKIPDFERYSAELGLRSIPSCSDKTANVIE